MDNFDLVMKRLGVDFVGACRWLADEHHIIVDEWKPSAAAAGAAAAKVAVFDAKRYEGFFLRPWLSGQARRFLFEERRLDPRVTDWCRLTSWRDRQGVNWLQIPFFDTEGQLIGVQNRNLQQGALPRFRFPLGSRCGIYNLPVLKRLRPGDELWITEGCSDCWAMLSAGHKAIAIPSATLLSPRKGVQAAPGKVFSKNFKKMFRYRTVSTAIARPLCRNVVPLQRKNKEALRKNKGPV